VQLHARIIVPLVGALALTLPAGAGATQARVPPGLSGANQYTESLPGGGGNETTGGVREAESRGGAAAPAKVLGHRNAARLEALGPEGQAAARLAAAGAASGGKGASDAHGGGSAESSPAGQILGQVTGSSSGSGGMGLLLPLLILGAVLCAGVYVFARRRLTAGGG
jgi:hypothetical protein